MTAARRLADDPPMKADLPPTTIDLAREAPFRLGLGEVRPATREVVWRDQREAVEPRVMQVLVALHRADGAVVSRDDLIRDCWNGRIVGDDAINRCIVQLRRLAERVGGFSVETIPRVGYRLAGGSRRPGRRRLWIIGAGLAAASLAGLVLALGLWVFGPPTPTHSDIKVAVAPIRPVGGEPAVGRFAQSLSDDLAGGLGASVASGPSPAGRGADFVVQGIAETEGSALRANLHLADGRSGAALWSGSFSGAASDQAGLRERAVVAIAAAVKCAAQARDPRAGPIGVEPLQRFLRTCSILENPEATQDVLANLRYVTSRAPGFAPGFARLAVFAAEADREVDPDLAPPLRAEGAAAAARALQLNPHEGTAYQALEMLVEPRSNWAERQRLLSRGLALDPNNAALAARQGLVLVGEGRLKEAAIFQRRAVALDPASANAAAELGDTLAATGSLLQAARVLIRAHRLWPQNGHVTGVLFANTALSGHVREAIAMLGDPSVEATGAEAPEQAVWRQALEALDSGSADKKAKARAALRDAVRTHVVWAPDAVRGLSTLGDVDGAIAVAETFASQHPDYEPTYLFKSGAGAMRRDPRFMQLAQKLGLTTWWRAQNRWPDFCSEPGLPYDCRAEAARLARAIS